MQDLRARNVGGHEVRRELDSLELKVKNARNRLHQKRFGQAGSTGDQTVASGKEGDEDLFDHLLLANDNLREFGFNLRPTAAQALHGCPFSLGRG